MAAKSKRSAAPRRKPAERRKQTPVSAGQSVGKLCDRAAVTVPASTTIIDAAKRMRDQHVGALIVVDGRKADRPLGIVTDRDVVVGVVAFDLDCSVFTVGDMMSPTLATLRDTDRVEDAISLMRSKGVRRLPVIGASGRLAGIVALDDLLEHLAGQLCRVVEAVRREQAREARTRKRVF